MQNRISDRYFYISEACKMARYDRYQLGYNEDAILLLQFEHFWGGDAKYITIARFYSTMSDEQIIKAIKVIIGLEEWKDR